MNDKMERVFGIHSPLMILPNKTHEEHIYYVLERMHELWE